MTKDILRMWHEQVIRPIVLYAADIWGKRSRDTRVRKLHNSIQKPFLLLMVPAYPTAPTIALQVIGGVEAGIRCQGSLPRKQYRNRVKSEWQREWDKERTGRTLYRIVGK